MLNKISPSNFEFSNHIRTIFFLGGERLFSFQSYKLISKMVIRQIAPFRIYVINFNRERKKTVEYLANLITVKFSNLKAD